ncbi:hypothetical protein BCR44DRAFT_47687 [Catenaria anguillulae PL171]|uniref:Uncharacterized protein n=1 Tax=Catenaria anguillulae PL171 TaxID=765915 RepID=A0A1Y2HN91_9FUNG|nr:hypothetical protein BCR44DRAFT_47687 [Catenaria anguillulae PL171]
MSTDSIAPCLPYELIEDLVVHLLAHILQKADASTILPSFLSPTLAHTLLCILPAPPPRLTSLVFIRLKHCHPTAFAAHGDPLLIRRVAREHHLARVTFRHWHRSPWSLSQTAAHYECSEIEWLQSVAAGASRGNQVHVLDWLVRQPEAKGYSWKLMCTSAAVVNVSSNPVVVASAYGAVRALEWWRHALKEHGWMRCERATKLAIECMALAAARGHVDTVRWWAGQVGANMSEGSIWEQVQVPLKRLGMDSDRFKGILAAARMPTGSLGFALRMGASP